MLLRRGPGCVFLAGTITPGKGFWACSDEKTITYGSDEGSIPSHGATVEGPREQLLFSA